MSSEIVHVCERCGERMDERKCKITLPELRLLPGLQRPVSTRVFLLASHLRGERAQMVMSPRASFPSRASSARAKAPRSATCSAFSPASTAGQQAGFTRAPSRRRRPTPPACCVITPDAGLRPPEVPLTRAGLRAAARVDISVDSRRYRRPLERDARGAGRCAPARDRDRLAG